MRGRKRSTPNTESETQTLQFDVGRWTLSVRRLLALLNSRLLLGEAVKRTQSPD